jgi:predicted dithiol-disulfide oxidoreductase (DUF899 family)
MNTETIKETDMEKPKVVSHEQWTKARLELLSAEKQFTRQRDELTRRRMAMPWERVEKSYVFDTAEGKRGLAELFDGRRQLMVQHFMLAPGWEEGCKSCSYMADHTDGMTAHLAHRDVTFLAISRAPLAEIERFRRRMGWQFKWVSSYGSDFNYDFGVSFTPEQVEKGKVCYNYSDNWPYPHAELPGVSVFYKDEAGAVFHTYSTYGRGVEVMMGTYNMLDLAPQGRDEDQLKFTMEWVRHHDRYESAPVAASCCAAEVKQS